MNNHLLMFGSYVKTGLRALLRQKVHLALNLIGLSVGLAAAVLILLYVQFESGYDQMHPKAQNTYRVEQYFLPLEQRFPISSPAILAETCRLLAPIRFFGINLFSSKDPEAC